jgi:hypothetical protein
METDALTTLADVYLAQHRPHRAAVVARAALAIRRRTGYRLDRARTRRTLRHARRLTRGIRSRRT